MSTSLETRLRYLDMPVPEGLVAQVLGTPAVAPRAHRRVTVLAVGAVMAVALGATATTAISSFDGPAFIPWRESSRDPAIMYTRPGPFSEEQAKAHAEELAASYLEDTIAAQYPKDGRPLRLSDFGLVSGTFVAGVPCENPTPGFECDGMHDHWTFTWRLPGTVIGVSVTFEDLTGVTKGAGAGTMFPE